MKRDTTNIKVDKELAYLLSIYCKLHQQKMVDVASEALKNKLHGFDIRKLENANVAK